MTRSRRVVVAFAVVMSLLAITAMPAAASHGPVVVSNHTTDSDFNSATELTNMSVDGTGESASVSLDENVLTYNAVDDEGDGFADSARQMIGDDANNNDLDSEFRFDPTASGNINEITIATTSGTDGSDYGFTVDVYIVEEAPDNTVGEGTLVASNYNPSFSGDLTIDISDYSVTAGSTYTLELDTSGSDNDGTTDAIAFAVDSSATTTWMTRNANDFNQYADIDYSIQSSPNKATYVSASHSATNTVGGFADITTADNVTITATWRGDSNGDGTFDTLLNQTTGITSTANHSFTWSEFSGDDVRVNVTVESDGTDPAFSMASEGVEATAAAPTIDDGSASPTGEIATDSPTLEIDVNDSDFAKAHGDSVEVEFFVDGSSIGTDTLTSNGTASVTVSNALTGGDHTWNATATDDYGHSNTSDDFTISTPGEITIRNETSPYGLVTGANATLRFFEDEDDNPTIVERTDDDDDGNISLSGLPVDGEFVVSIKADGYNNRTITIEDIFEQETVFLLSTDRPTIENRFTVEDRTGDFPPEETQLIIQKPINQSEYDSSADGFEWMNVAGDDLGADEAFVTDLEEGDRYRIKVQNDDGDQRILGAYTAETAGTINLVIGRVTLDPTATGQPAYDAERTNESGSPVKVTFEYNDSEDSTTQIWLHIYEYNNQSNELLANTSFTPSSGNFGLFTNTENVPDAENGTTWVVDFTAERDGEDNVNGRMIVGPRDDILSDMPAWLLSIIYVGSLLIVAGLFSQLNAEVGALVVAALGAIFFFAGFAPAGVGSGVVVLALMVAGALFVQGRRSGI